MIEIDLKEKFKIWVTRSYEQSVNFQLILAYSDQALLIYLFVDLLQRCQVAQMESVKVLLSSSDLLAAAELW